MARYAAGTDVPVRRSRSEIEDTLERYGAKRSLFATETDAAIVMFEMEDRLVRFVLPLPNRDDRAFWRTHHKPPRQATPEAAEKAWEQACRQRWRALALAIKAKLESVESGIATFEDEFMANIVLPDDRTVGEHMRPQIEAAYEGGEMPKLLPNYRD
jgi:hypothetical protein